MLMESLRSEERVAFLNGETKHRRGGYTFVSAGPTHGNGRKVCPFLLLSFFLCSFVSGV